MKKSMQSENEYTNEEGDIEESYSNCLDPRFSNKSEISNTEVSEAQSVAKPKKSDPKKLLIDLITEVIK